LIGLVAARDHPFATDARMALISLGLLSLLAGVYVFVALFIPRLPLPEPRRWLRFPDLVIEVKAIGFATLAGPLGGEEAVDVYGVQITNHEASRTAVITAHVFRLFRDPKLSEPDEILALPYAGSFEPAKGSPQHPELNPLPRPVNVAPQTSERGDLIIERAVDPRGLMGEPTRINFRDHLSDESVDLPIQLGARYPEREKPKR
jgi:hypothetical protein